MIYVLLNVVGRSSKKSDMIRDINLEVVHKTWGCAMLTMGRLLNQEQCLQRPKDISWDSHSKTLKSLVEFQSITEVLELVPKLRHSHTKLRPSKWFNVFSVFSFPLHLASYVKKILTTTNTLSLALQQMDQDILMSWHVN
jgi:hypothetical protein